MKFTIWILIAFTVVTVSITGFWNYINEIVFPNSKWGLYDRDFFENLLVELHGGIIDLLIVSVLLFWFDSRRTKNELINRLKSEISSLKYYYGPDASFKFYAKLRYLLSLGVPDVSVPDGNMMGLKIESLSLTNSNLIAVNFSESTLIKVKFQKCDLEASQFKGSKLKHCEFQNVNLNRSKFIKAQLKGMNFETCKLENVTFRECSLESAIFKGVDCTGVSFEGSNLRSANFKGVDCTRVSFKGSNLRSANFQGASNITKEMILEASNYERITLPDGLNL